MAVTLTITGDGAKYSVRLSGMDTSLYYYVFIDDLSSTGTVSAYVCRRIGKGVSSTWGYDGSSDPPYCNYIRSVQVRTSKTALSFTVGTKYSSSDITKATFLTSKNIPKHTTPTRYYRIHAYANNGSFSDDETVWNSGLLTETTEETTVYYSVSKIPTPYRSGYTFQGWGDSATTTSVYSSSINIYVGDSSASNPRDKSVYAVWKENPKTFTFKLSPTNQGVSAYYVYVNDTQKISSSSTNESTITAYNSDTIRIAVVMKGIYNNGSLVNGNGFNDPLITAYADSNSYNDASEYMKIDSNYPGSVTSIPRYQDYSFTAEKRPHHHTFAIGATAKSYGYTLYANNGTWPSGTDPQKGYVKSTQQLNLANFIPTRSGYQLLGWSTNQSATGPSSSYPLGGSIYLTDSITIYAVWTKIYYLIFHSNGGKWSNRASIVKPCAVYFTKSVELGSEAAGDIDHLSREGYSLLGWSLDENATTNSFASNGTFKCPNRIDNLDIYAIWKKSAIDKFYWYTNDAEDATYIAEGEPIANLKFSAWNRLKMTIEKLYRNLSLDLPDDYSTIRVTSGNTISAKDFNGIRSAISSLPNSGTVPNKVKEDDIIGASLFVGDKSLKSALNKAIDAWNN